MHFNSVKIGTLIFVRFGVDWTRAKVVAKNIPMIECEITARNGSKFRITKHISQFRKISGFFKPQEESK